MSVMGRWFEGIRVPSCPCTKYLHLGPRCNEYVPQLIHPEPAGGFESPALLLSPPTSKLPAQPLR